MTTPEHAATLFVTGSVFFPGMFFSLQQCWREASIGIETKKRFNLSKKDCADISVKLVSTLQAILAVVSGKVICSACHPDVFLCTHPVVMNYAWFGAPYFIYDALAMFYVSTIKEEETQEDEHNKQCSHVKKRSKARRNGGGVWKLMKKFYRFISKSPVIILHHMIMAPIGFTIITYFRGDRGGFFIGVMYLMEASTPFVSFRAILSKLKLKNSPLYKLNGGLMLLTFPLFRIFSVFYTVFLYAEQQRLSFAEAFHRMHFGWLMVFVGSIGIQVYWYSLMLRGLLKIWINGCRKVESVEVQECNRNVRNVEKCD